MTESLLFSQTIEMAKKAEVVSDDITRLEHLRGSRLRIRLQGCFITELAFSDKASGAVVNVLYSDQDHTISKMTASHMMSPVGPSDGIGGQHGFPRWASYREFPQLDGLGGEKRVAFQARRPDDGLGISKVFILDEDKLVTEMTIFNSEETSSRTSLGEHLYFILEDENLDRLTVDGQSLDELLGEGSEAAILEGKPLFWSNFQGNTVIGFPAGYRVELQAHITGNFQNHGLGMLIWHRTGSPSICFEPTAGFDPSDGNDCLEVEAYGEAKLMTSIKLMS